MSVAAQQPAPASAMKPFPNGPLIPPPASVGPEYFRPDMPHELCKESQLNPREFFEEQGLDELGATILTNGLIEPIVVRPMGAYFEIVCGARRWRAAGRVGVKTLPVRVMNLTDAQALEMMIVENDQRKDVTSLERAKGYTRLMEADPKYRDRVVLAARIGKTLSWLHAAMKLLELIPPAQKALVTGLISESHAIEIARLTPEGQKEALDECVRQDNRVGEKIAIPVRSLRAWIQQNWQLDLDKAPFTKDDATLVPPAGPCTTCPKRAGANPALFQDVKKADTCTDRTCFQGKCRAHTVRQLRALAADDGVAAGANPDLNPRGGGAVAISTAYYVDADTKKTLGVEVLAQPAWVDAGKKVCPHTRSALVVHADRGAVGGKKKVCVEPKTCAVHGASSGRRAPTASEKAAATARKTKEKKRRTESAARRELLAGIRDKVTELREADVRLVAVRFLFEMHADRQKEVYGLMGWPTPEKSKRTYGGSAIDFRKAAETQLAAAPPAVLAQFLVVAALSTSIQVHEYLGSAADAKPLFETAKRWKVDAASIAREKAAQAARLGPSRLVVSDEDMARFVAVSDPSMADKGTARAVSHDGLLYVVSGSVWQGGGNLPLKCSAHRIYLKSAWPFPKLKTGTVEQVNKGRDASKDVRQLAGVVLWVNQLDYVIGPGDVEVVRAKKAVQTSTPKSAKKKR